MLKAQSIGPVCPCPVLAGGRQPQPPQSLAVASVTGLQSGLTTRPLVHADLPAVLDLMVADEQAVLGEPMIELEDLEADWQRPSYDAEQDSVGVFDGGRLVAYGEVYQGRRAEITVHPQECGRGIGSALMRWSWRRAREAGGALVGQSVPDQAHQAVALFRRNGYSPLWTSWFLALPAGGRLPSVGLPAGYAIRPFRPGADEHAAYRVIEDAFSEWPDRDPSGYDDWAATVLGRPGFEPWHLSLAVRTTDAGDAEPVEEVVGACHLFLTGDTGWVNQVAVAAGHRRRRLAQALLAHAFAEARRHGASRAELATDSRTGALGLYQHLGMQVTLAFTHWARPLDDVELAPG
jgi:ribosomal protein S18 acetylase RimI-like enzyme